MGKLVVTEFVSLDGVMQAPGGEEFKYPGWSFAFDRGEDGNQFKFEETLETEALLIGRVTYKSFADAWPKREGEFADKFNTMPSTSCPRRSRSRSGTTRRSSRATSSKRPRS